LPPSSSRLSFSSGASQVPQVAFTLIPHFSHLYVAIFSALFVGPLFENLAAA
jgi:hypothetical protein